MLPQLLQHHKIPNNYPTMNLDIDALLSEIASLEVPDAIRLSGEELARVDNAWRKAHNAKQPTTQLLVAVSRLAQCHCDLLFRAAAYADAYATAVTVMMSVSLDDACTECMPQMLALCVIAASSLEQLGAQMPHDEFTTQHMPIILTYVASLMYCYYQKTFSVEQTQWHGIAYEMLRDFANAGAIQQPAVTVGDKAVDPLHPFDIFSDLAGRSIALGLLSGEA
jgi:hypothetical protein